MGLALASLFANTDDAATPLTSEEILGLIPSHIAYRSELNAAEQENMVRGQAWALARRRELLNEKFVKELHRRMLGDVWRWAGRFRVSERNIGIAHWEIPVAMRVLLDDVRVWIECRTYSSDEIAVRLHHRLVSIHPFPNGNGRHSRLMADLLIMQLGRDRFTWGRESLRDAGSLRARYIEGLKAADNGDIGPLVVFARS